MCGLFLFLSQTPVGEGWKGLGDGCGVELDVEQGEELLRDFICYFRLGIFAPSEFSLESFVCRGME